MYFVAVMQSWLIQQTKQKIPFLYTVYIPKYRVASGKTVLLFQLLKQVILIVSCSLYFWQVGKHSYHCSLVENALFVFFSGCFCDFHITLVFSVLTIIYVSVVFFGFVARVLGNIFHQSWGILKYPLLVKISFSEPVFFFSLSDTEATCILYCLICSPVCRGSVNFFQFLSMFFNWINFYLFFLKLIHPFFFLHQSTIKPIRQNFPF